MNWRSTTVDRLVESLVPTIPPTAMIAAVAADEAGYAVKLSDSCPLDGRFEIGSVTKTMTGIVLASLVNDGTLSLDDEIGRWLDAGQNSEITLGQLATHTSGLPRLSPSHRPAAEDPYAFLTAEVAEREIRLAGPRERGVEWDYSNFGFQVLSLVLERAAGIPFGSLLEQCIFQQLDMTCSGIPGHGKGTRVQGHSQGGPVTPWTRHLFGAGGVGASAEDMARYLEACLKPPDSPVGLAIRLVQQPHPKSTHCDRPASAGHSVRPAISATTAAPPASGRCSESNRTNSTRQRYLSTTEPHPAWHESFDCPWTATLMNPTDEETVAAINAATGTALRVVGRAPNGKLGGAI